MTGISLTIPTAVLGTPTNNDAAAGYVGEYVFSTILIGSPVSLATGVTSNVTSITLTAGDWDVSGAVSFYGDATTTVSVFAMGVSSTTATLPNPGTPGRSDQSATGTPFANNVVSLNTIQTRFSLAAPTTIYLVAICAFAVSTATAFGTIEARRVR